MVQQPTPKQMLILWALIAKGGGSFARSKKNDIKPDVDAGDKKTLTATGLITVEKRSTDAGTRADWLEVSDKGWAWAGENLTAPLGTKSTAGTVVLQELLARLQSFLQARNISLAELIVPSINSAKMDGQATAPKQDYPALRDRIRSAYKSIAGSFNKRVLLRDLRSELQSVSRARLDEALLKITREEEADLISLDNPCDITDADKDAAIRIGEQQRHILWISR